MGPGLNPIGVGEVMMVEEVGVKRRGARPLTPAVLLTYNDHAVLIGDSGAT